MKKQQKWRQAWSRSDAVSWFGEEAVAAVEAVTASWSVEMRATSSGPFRWLEAVPDDVRRDSRFFFFADKWRVLERGEEAFRLALELTTPAREDIHLILDVAARLTDWAVVGEARDGIEPPHYEGASVSFCAWHKGTSPRQLLRIVVDVDTCAVHVAVLG